MQQLSAASWATSNRVSQAAFFCNALYSYLILVLIQELFHNLVPTLVKVVVPYTWTMLTALEQSTVCCPVRLVIVQDTPATQRLWECNASQVCAVFVSCRNVLASSLACEMRLQYS